MIFVLTVLLGSLTSQAGLLVASPQLSEKTYRQVLQQRPDLISLPDWEVQKDSERPVRKEIFTLADTCLADALCKDFENHFEKIRKDVPLNSKEFRLLFEVWKKVGRPEDCYWKNLMGKASSCSEVRVNLEMMGLLDDPDYAVVIDGQVFRKGQAIQVLPRQKYHWRIFSSRFLKKQAWATVEELQFQVSLKEAFVSGGCLASNTHSQSVADSEPLWVAFDETCVKPAYETRAAIQPQSQDSWYQKNKIWIWSGLGVGLGAAYYLRDKKVEWTWPQLF